MLRFLPNIKSGLTVSLISLPLSISFSVASGVAPSVGIITAIWAGFVAAIFGGSNYNITGPTGALSGLIATFVLTNGPTMVSALAVTTGFIILLAYILNFERYLIFIPSSVIHGFTLGVACIIAFNQLNYILGLHNLPQHSQLINNLWESLSHVSSFSAQSGMLFLLFFSALIVLRKTIPHIPGAIILSPIGILVG